MQIWSNPRFANVTALLALVVALGGTSYAAVSLPKNSVTSKQVKNHTLRRADFKSATLLAGPAGPAGPSGPKGDAGRSALTQLQSGESISGAIGGSMNAASAGLILDVDQQFSIPIPSNLDAAHAVVTASTTANCAGAGQAAPGFLCVYLTLFGNVNMSPGQISAFKIEGGPGASKVGFGVEVHALNPGLVYLGATYTYRAP